MDGNRYLDQNTIKDLVGIPEAALDHVMATAYRLYTTGQYAQVEILCRGLIAADHKYWWAYSLYASALRKLHRLEEALSQLDRGLKYEPAQAKLLLMRGEILAALGRTQEAAADLAPAAVTGRPADRLRAGRQLAQLGGR